MGKRVFDLSVGLVLCILATPVILAGAVLTMIALRTPSPFFVHSRLGYQGKSVRIPKLRTMPVTTPAYALKTNISFENLPRICRFLRRYHVDELPQLFLVLTGHLSLVGPRPKMPDAFEPIDAAYGATRVQVPQGCTGLWQVSKAKPLLPAAHPEFDLFYVANHSLRLDLWILWRTLAHGLQFTDAITLDDVPAWTLRRATTRGGVLDLTSSVRHAEPEFTHQARRVATHVPLDSVHPLVVSQRVEQH